MNNNNNNNENSIKSIDPKTNSELPSDYCNSDTGKVLCQNSAGIPLSPEKCNAKGELLENFINTQVIENNNLINKEKFDNIDNEEDDNIGDVEIMKDNIKIK